jgi:hypothetical protein
MAVGQLPTSFDAYFFQKNPKIIYGMPIFEKCKKILGKKMGAGEGPFIGDYKIL